MRASTIKEKINKIVDEDIIPHLPSINGITYERKQSGSGIGDGGLTLVTIKYNDSYLDSIMIGDHLTFTCSNAIITDIEKDVEARILRHIKKTKREDSKYTEIQLQREVDALEDIKKTFEVMSPIDDTYEKYIILRINENMYFRILNRDQYSCKPAFFNALAAVNRDMKSMSKKALFSKFQFRVVQIKDRNGFTNAVLPSSAKMLLKKVLERGTMR